MLNTILSKHSCPKCGAPLEIHNANTQTIVCGSCQSYIAVGSQTPTELAGQARFTPGTPIAIGAKMMLDGTNFFVLGHVQYEGWDPNDRSDRWKWDEYLLGGDDGRMVWLSYDEKGFGLFTKQRLTGEFNILKSRVIPTRDGTKAAVSERYPAKIVGARGELTWLAKPGDEIYMAEGAGGGKRYSVQQSDQELEIYEGRAIDTLDVARALGDEAWIKRIKGKKSRQQLAGLAAALCIVFAAISLLMAAFFNSFGERVLQERFQVDVTQQLFSYDVELDQINRPSIVSLNTSPLRVNSFADFDVSVTSPNGVTTFLFEKSLWHETGRDSDGPWTDTSYRASNMFVPTVAGVHTLEIMLDPSSTATLPLQMTLTVRRNHVTPLWLVVYAVVIGAIGGIALFKAIV